ncbi:MAG: hypothetical protein HZB38_03360 [Planctomycetes bacterium]|nr:hypothetical protein [Planctomycetota bacterium]
MFYFEVHERQFDERTMSWSSLAPEGAFQTNVETPRVARLEGFDVVTFFAQASPECSPLSCNALAEKLPVNAHCLFDSFKEAKAALDAGEFNHSEPGPFRIFSVHSVDT